VDLRADLLSQRAAFKIELPHITRGGADQTAVAEWNQLGESIVLTSLNDLANLAHLTISIKLVNRRTKHYS
jgi:hypothetical protein